MGIADECIKYLYCHDPCMREPFEEQDVEGWMRCVREGGRVCPGERRHKQIIVITSTSTTIMNRSLDLPPFASNDLHYILSSVSAQSTIQASWHPPSSVRGLCIETFDLETPHPHVLFVIPVPNYRIRSNSRKAIPVVRLEKDKSDH